jgi:microcystin-dependent protein
MNKEIFYCSLDQFDSSNAVINPWAASRKDVTIKLDIKNPELPLVSFDRFKGSFLRIRNKTMLHLFPGNDDLLFGNSTLSVNIFLNISTIAGSAKNNFIFFDIKIDEFLITFYLVKNSENSNIAEIYVDCRMIEDQEETADVIVNQKTGIEINLDYWYNFNLNINKKGMLELSALYINSVLNSGSVSSSLAGGYQLDLNEFTDNDHTNFRQIHSLIFGSENNKGEFNVSDLYLFKGLNEEELWMYIEKGVNVSSKYTYRSKISFEIFTDYQDEVYKGIQFFDRRKEKYILKLLPDRYSFTSRTGNSRIIIKLKKGFFTINDSKENRFEIKEENDELHISMDFNDSLLEYELPDIKTVNIANTEKLFVQCEITDITVFENNNPVEVCESVSMDQLIFVKDLSKKSTIPLEIMVLGEPSFEIKPNTEILVQLNLINKSEYDLKFIHEESHGAKGRLKLNSLFWKQLIPKDAISLIKIEAKRISANKLTEIKELVFKCEQDEVFLETNQSFIIKKNEFIRLKISGLKINALSELTPPGAYPFQIQFENIEDYNNGSIPFTLNFIAKKELSCPVGSIVAFYTRDIPENWLLCDGQSIDEKLYPELYNLLQHKNVPDLRNRFLVGAGNNYPLGSTGGQDSVTLQTSQIPAHTHHITGIQSNNEPFKDVDLGWMRREEMHGVYGTDRTVYYYKSDKFDTKFFNTKTSTPIQSTGEGLSHENRPPYHAVYYIIKAK